MIIGEKKKVSRFIFLCSFIYFISYVTRTNYGAIIAEMVTSTGQSKSALAYALTGSFITYGAGQLISGYFGDRVQPKLLITLGLLTTIAMNTVIPFCTSTVQMTVVWCVNGFAQSFMWPPLVKLMATLLSAHDYNTGCVRVSWGGSLGTMFIYLVSPLLISQIGWRSVFWMSALIGIFGVLLWWKLCPNIELAAPVSRKTEQAAGIRLFSPVLIISLLAILLQGTLRDGVTTWMPSYVAEVFSLSNEVAILVGVVLPVFSILCHAATEALCSKKFTNMFQCAAVIFGTGAVSALLLCLFTGSSAVLSVLCLSLLAGCMHGVNLLLVCMLPPYFAKGGKVSVVSGLMNSVTYVGSALSAYVIPLATENAGWHVTLLLWLAMAILGTLMCVLCIPSWKKMA